ncbi:MAG: FAD:protein FMN transferase [Gemmataceae bacterium]|nr:FAD:protein FMN transferase [Gemmataceae bacterium]
MSRDSAFLRYSTRAMATQFEVVVPWGTPRAAESAEAAFARIAGLEAQLSVYRDTSEVSRLNRIGFQMPVPVEARLFALLQQCSSISKATAGAFDITSGPLTKAWGFYRRQGRVPTVEELEEARSGVGMEKVQLDAATNRVRLLHPTTEVNFGSIGKGYALDEASRMLNETPALLHGGTSSILATGRVAEPWVVGIRHPSRPCRLGQLLLSDRAMASSGATHQRFVYNGVTLGHVIDPRTGWPARGVALAVAVAPTAAEADALSTAFYVLGEPGTREFCDRRPDIGAILLDDADDAKPLLINIAPDTWTADDTELIEAGTPWICE